MTNADLVRAMKDPEFRASLGDLGRTAMQQSPIGALGLGHDQLRRAAGAHKMTTAWFCTLYSAMSRCCG